MKTRFKPYKSQGFTLLELVLCIVLIGILAIGGSEMLSASFSVVKYSDSESRAYSESRYAMDRLTNEIREINYPSVATGSCVAAQYCVYAPTSFTAPSSAYAIAPGSSFGFYKGTTNDNMSINMVGSTLQLNSYPLLKNVSALNLTFYDANLSNLAPTKNNLKFIIIVMTVSAPNVQPFTLRTRVALRNSA